MARPTSRTEPDVAESGVAALLDQTIREQRLSKRGLARRMAAYFDGRLEEFHAGQYAPEHKRAEVQRRSIYRWLDGEQPDDHNAEALAASLGLPAETFIRRRPSGAEERQRLLSRIAGLEQRMCRLEEHLGLRDP